MRKAVIVIAAVVVGIVGGVITLSSCKRVGQGEVGVVWTMKIKAEAEAGKDQNCSSGGSRCQCNDQ